MNRYRLGLVCSEGVNYYVISATLISAFQQTKTFQLIVFIKEHMIQQLFGSTYVYQSKCNNYHLRLVLF